MGIYLNDFRNSYISCGMAPPHIIGASDFAVRKVSFITQTKTNYPMLQHRPFQNIKTGGNELKCSRKRM